MHAWVYDPHSGGVKIPTAVKQSVERRVRSYAEAHYGGKFTRLELRFRGMFCYIDAYTEPTEPPASLLLALKETREQYIQRCRNVPLHLCRLRFFGDEDRWSMAFYTPIVLSSNTVISGNDKAVARLQDCHQLYRPVAP